MTYLDGSSVLHITTVVRGLHLLETCFIELQHGDHVTDSRPTVVFADDNLKVTEVACALLNSAYEVVKVAVDGEEAIRSILELEPDVAVLDISMPRMDGISVARQLQRVHSNTRIVFLTLINDDDYIEMARSLGHGYVLKRRLSSDLLTALTSARDGSFFCSQ
jgi:DNA-binding NarL/FixJ family response regulator